jgi:hypothetical protein
MWRTWLESRRALSTIAQDIQDFKLLSAFAKQLVQSSQSDWDS